MDRQKTEHEQVKLTTQWALIGIPDHEGVLHVGGRLGASGGPRAVRKVMQRFSGEIDVRAKLHDLGDCGPFLPDVEHNLAIAAAQVRVAQSNHPITVVVGGSHEHGYSQLHGVSQALPGARIGCINIDAHLDVRKPAPTITSGSPFFLALERNVIAPQNLIQFGIQSQANSPALFSYCREKGVQIIEFRELRENAVARFKTILHSLASRCDALVISLDLDALSEDNCPGVSAPQAEGFSARELMAMLEAAGETPQTRSLGIFELNPLHDVGDRTARLAATAIYRFVSRALARELPVQ